MPKPALTTWVHYGVATGMVTLQEFLRLDIAPTASQAPVFNNLAKFY